MEPIFKVDGTSSHVAVDNGKEYAVWRVVIIKDPSHMICAFYGGASYDAAHRFCAEINADPEYRKHAAR
jgi:hypothetical protein